MVRAGRISLLLAVACAAVPPAPALADRVKFKHGVLEGQLSTRTPGSPTGTTYTGNYHAADDPDRDPPQMGGMIFYPTPGFRYDTRVPVRCTASDQELALSGGEACPRDSQIGGGSVRSKFMGFETETPVQAFNYASEVVMVARSPFVATVIRGQIRRDQSVEWRPPRCYPALAPRGCPADNVLQLSSAIRFPPYVRGGRSYMTTAPTCPRSRSWRSRIRFWWDDGSEYTVVVRNPCRRSRRR
jgi:hypothetical protein